MLLKYEFNCYILGFAKMPFTDRGQVTVTSCKDRSLGVVRTFWEIFALSAISSY
jgi:hypothetical protein